jgi:hypothetical protein
MKHFILLFAFLLLVVLLPAHVAADGPTVPRGYSIKSDVDWSMLPQLFLLTPADTDSEDDVMVEQSVAAQLAKSGQSAVVWRCVSLTDGAIACAGPIVIFGGTVGRLAQK